MDNENNIDQQDVLETMEQTERDNGSRSRSERKTNYVRSEETKIPQEIVDIFAEDNWDLALKRWRLANVMQNSHIATKRREGWEFVTASELPDDYAAFFEVEQYKGREEAVVVKDMVLMKADKALTKSRREHFEGLARKELAAVDVNILEKKGFQDLGSKSSVTMFEPKFKS